VRSVVNRLSLSLQISNAHKWIRTCQQRSLNGFPLVRCLSLEPGVYRLGAGVEGDDSCSLAAEHGLAPHFRIDGCTAAGGNHYLILSQKLPKDGAFAGPECGLPLIPEDSWDGYTPVPLNLEVSVSCRPSQLRCKTSRDARFARAAEPDQHDPVDLAHVLLKADFGFRSRPV
jgi:hypothetical protein